MLFPTLTFAGFFAVVYPLSCLLRSRPRAWKLLILGASYVFYGFWDWRFVLLVMLSSVVNAELGRKLAAAAGRRRRLLLISGVVFNLTLLGVFKYYGFFIDSANTTLHNLGLPADLPLLEIILPVGISFFTFQAISYLVDLNRGRLQPASLLDFCVYLTFFPHVVAGPIVRASEFLPQLSLRHQLTEPEVTRAFVLIAQGLFLKLVISSNIATAIVDPVFAVPAQYSSLEVLAAIYGYAVQIYADFAGYTSMAIGIALLLGIRFPQNFNRPYSAVSLQEFWHRWHMTLSRWLRDYLYIPLGGSRHGTWQTYRNLILTMVLGGLWHGAALTFVAWGLLHGVGMAGERVLSGRFLRTPFSPWVGRLLTFNFVCVAWVLFRAPSLGAAGEILHRSVTAWGPAPSVTLGVVVVIVGMLALQVLPPAPLGWVTERYGRLPLAAQGAVLGAAFALAVALGPSGVPPFIYYQF
jgi:D-alanyl-lipoteichoic acid acyltransferase DltB (MBOAT superfamily)